MYENTQATQVYFWYSFAKEKKLGNFFYTQKETFLKIFVASLCRKVFCLYKFEDWEYKFAKKKYKNYVHQLNGFHPKYLLWLYGFCTKKE